MTEDLAKVLLGPDKARAIELIRAHHYTKSVPSGKSHYVQFGDAIVVWSIPANKNIARFVLKETGGVVWELSRLWAPDGHAPNLLTRAISAAVKELQKLEPIDAVVSYADPSVGHHGGVYKAASWISHGQSEEVRAWRKGDGPIIARRAFHCGSRHFNKAEVEAMGYTQLKLPGKHRFIRLLSKRAKKLHKKNAGTTKAPAFKKAPAKDAVPLEKAGEL